MGARKNEIESFAVSLELWSGELLIKLINFILFDMYIDKIERFCPCLAEFGARRMARTCTDDAPNTKTDIVALAIAQIKRSGT